MKIWARYALSTGVAAALLAGCGGSQPPGVAPAAVPQSHIGPSPASVSGAGYKTLYSFGLAPDGFHPTTALIESDGLFYGTTRAGGYADSGTCDSCGTVYSITRDGSEKVIYRFPGLPGGNGPDGHLLVKDGALYGTTFYGGNAVPNKCVPSNGKGCGIVFEVTRDGRQRTIHAFIGRDGENPESGLIQHSALYGTTTASDVRGVFGTVFRISFGKLESIHNFTGAPDDGRFPVGRLAELKGKLYGVTAAGGTHDAGTIFEATPAGTEQTLRSFSGSDGADPAGGLLENNGLLYGVASSEGPHNHGAVFAISPSGSYHIVHAFRGPSHGDGADPQAPPILVNGTTLYGTTYRGGTHGLGTVYEIDQHGKETVLHSFGPAPDGIHPKASLLYRDGTLYGTTMQGGEGAAVGTVFALTPP